MQRERQLFYDLNQFYSWHACALNNYKPLGALVS